MLYSHNQEKDEKLLMHQVHNRVVFLYFEHMFESYLPFFLKVFYNSDFVLTGGFYYTIIEDVSQNRNEVWLLSGYHIASTLRRYSTLILLNIPLFRTYHFMDLMRRMLLFENCFEWGKFAGWINLLVRVLICIMYHEWTIDFKLKWNTKIMDKEGVLIFC